MNQIYQKKNLLWLASTIFLTIHTQGSKQTTFPDFGNDELVDKLKANIIGIEKTASGREHPQHNRDHILLPNQKPQQQKNRRFLDHLYAQPIFYIQQPNKKNHPNKNCRIYDACYFGNRDHHPYWKGMDAHWICLNYQHHWQHSFG